jgi:hypothetical protein
MICTLEIRQRHHQLQLVPCNPPSPPWDSYGITGLGGHKGNVGRGIAMQWIHVAWKLSRLENGSCGVVMLDLHTGQEEAMKVK